MNELNTTILLLLFISFNSFKESILSSNAYIYKKFITIAVKKKLNYNTVTITEKK